MHTNHSGAPIQILDQDELWQNQFPFFLILLLFHQPQPLHSNANELYNFHWLLRTAAARGSLP